MKITRRQLRKLISEAIKPGSKYDMYRKYGVTGGELDTIKDLTSHDDPEYREQGIELGRDMGMPIVDSTTYQVIAYQDQFLRNTDEYMYHDVKIPENIMLDIFKTWRKIKDIALDPSKNQSSLSWFERSERDREALILFFDSIDNYRSYIVDAVNNTGIINIPGQRWDYHDIKGKNSKTLASAFDFRSDFKF